MPQIYVMSLPVVEMHQQNAVYAIECFTGIGRGRSVVAASFSLKGCYRRKARCTLFPATKITIRQSGVSSGLLRVSSVNDLADTRRLLISSLMVLNSLPSLTGILCPWSTWTVNWT
ncbi:uncharacterized protein [Lolium perenne]|uniref:uncharacterized protein isoform X2 n=1 Tax=Lolium perenne TaxID=4522 RepID=UPI003A998DBC